MQIAFSDLKIFSFLFSALKIICKLQKYFFELKTHMHPKKPKGLRLDSGFQFFQYLGFGFGYFANLLQILN